MGRHSNVQVRMLSERHSTLTRLTLQVCDISEFDADVPLIFDLRPLAQASRVPKHSHILGVRPAPALGTPALPQ